MLSSASLGNLTRTHEDESPKGIKPSWIKKFGTSKFQSSPTTTSKSNMLRTLSNLRRRCSVEFSRMSDSSTPIKVPTDLQRIVDEYESAFESPRQKHTGQGGNFVKRIVAAFEHVESKSKLSSTPASDRAKKRPEVPIRTTSNKKESFHSKRSSSSSGAITDEETVHPDCSRLGVNRNNNLLTNNNNNNRNRQNSQLLNSIEIKREKAKKKLPKIVGAFLKKPVELEDTSIDWIPIPGKRLPRKRSLKKIISVLTGRRPSSKINAKFFQPPPTPSEVPNSQKKELHDSGYDEKSSSTPSLSSLDSFTEMLLNQSNSFATIERHRNLRTFRNSLMKKVGGKSESCGKVRLIMEDQPIAVHHHQSTMMNLGPSFPAKSGKSSNVTKSLDRKTPAKPRRLPALPQHPQINQISLPKHPHIKDNNEADLRSAYADCYQVELRRRTDSASSSSMEAIYDMPRRFLSRSENGMSQVSDFNGCNRESQQSIYDVPAAAIMDRPKSSVYEDAWSLKRRNENLGSITCQSGFYTFVETEEPHYATVKPRNKRINISSELLKPFGNYSYSLRELQTTDF